MQVRLPIAYLALGAVLVSAATVELALPANSETLIPRHIEYDVETQNGPDAIECVISLTIVNDPASPEIANFRVFIVEGRSNAGAQQMFVGFTLDVGNTKYVNGLPAGSEWTPLAKAAFSSPTFNSAGRLYESDMQDGGLGASTSDVQTGTAFFFAVEQGNYDLSFVAKDAPENRTYHVDPAPTVDVIKKFQKCLDTMEGG